MLCLPNESGVFFMVFCVCVCFSVFRFVFFVSFCFFGSFELPVDRLRLGNFKATVAPQKLPWLKEAQKAFGFSMSLGCQKRSPYFRYLKNQPKNIIQKFSKKYPFSRNRPKKTIKNIIYHFLVVCFAGKMTLHSLLLSCPWASFFGSSPFAFNLSQTYSL